jgi:transcriptional regulator with XRE-family HTH domain
MKRLGVRLDQSTLYNYEGGTVSAPDPGVLWALSKIYAVSHDELIAMLVKVRAGKTDAALPSSSTNPEFDDVEEKLIHAFRDARADAKRRILDFVEYEAHKDAGPRAPAREVIPKKGRSG